MNVCKAVVISLLVPLCTGTACAQSDKHIELLDIVWNTMNTEYFDPAFSGLDWQALYDQYKPVIARCESSDSVYYYLNKMLFTLGVSHLGVASPEEANEIGDPQLFLDGTLGLDVRMIDNRAVVTSVMEHSPAFEAGMRPGFVLTVLNGRTVEEIAGERKTNPTPPFNERNLKSMITQDVVREVYGEPGGVVEIEYLDVAGASHRKSLRLRDRSSEKTSLHPGLPPIYARLYSDVLPGDVGYIRFDVFHPVLTQAVVDLIRGFAGKAGIIIDIRGNPGGEFNTRRTIASQFATGRMLFWRYQRRDRTEDVYLDPPEKPYTGSLVILIDELSGSSSEEFAGAMKAVGRATVVGRRTAGKVLTMEVVPLPGGAIFVYPNGRTLTADNRALEGVGVVPDIEVALKHEDVANGVDTQLDAALEYLRRRGGKR